MPNPYENYGIFDYLSDMPITDIPRFFTSGHIGYYNDAPQMIERLRPELAGPRVDRNLQDQMLNFIGGYDMVARGMDAERAVQGARAYQAKDYFIDGRKQDAIGDYEENAAGARAYNPEQGRLSDEALIDLAVQFARDRMAQSQRNQ